jgi:protease IV
MSIFSYGAWALSDQFFNRVYPIIMAGHTDLLIEKKKAEDFYPIMEAMLMPDGMGVSVDMNARLLTVKDGSKNIALIPVVGALTKYGDACSLGMQDYQNMLSRANASPNIDGTVFMMDTPGGTVDGGPELALAIKNSPKPVGIFADGTLASMGVWLASQASVIVANKNNPTSIGSIGTLFMNLDYTKMMEMGTMPKVTIIRAPQSTEKALLNPVEQPISEENMAALKSELKGITDMFIGAVKSGRGDSLNAATEGLFKGRMFSAVDAKAAGLIDSVGTLKTAVSKVAELSRAQSKSTIAPQGQVNSNMKYPKLSAFFSGEAWGKALSAFTGDEQPLEAAEQKVADMEANLTRITGEKSAAETRATVAEAKVSELTAQVNTLATAKATLETEKATLQAKLYAAPAGAVTTVIEGEKEAAFHPTSIDAEAKKFMKPLKK